MSRIKELLGDIKKHASARRAKASAWFFKTGPGQYGEGDIFVGLTVPQMRVFAKKYFDLSHDNIKKLLYSKVHEERLIGLLILVQRFKTAESSEQGKIYKFYISNSRQVNNWDLVDLSAPAIVGGYLLQKSRKILYKLAKSKNLWQRRISIIATFKFIANSELKDTLKISEILLSDKHDLIHKATGWALREVGKKDEKVLKDFLLQNIGQMPRTMLRYAIERFPEKERKHFLNL